MVSSQATWPITSSNDHRSPGHTCPPRRWRSRPRWRCSPYRHRRWPGNGRKSLWRPSRCPPWPMVTPMVGDGWGVPLTLSDKPTLDTFRSSVGIKNAGLSLFFTSKEVAVVDVYANTHHRIVIKGSQNVYRETSNLLTIIGIMCRYHYFDLHPG